MTRIVNDVLISAIQVPILFNLVSGSEDEVEHLLTLIGASRSAEMGRSRHQSPFRIYAVVGLLTFKYGIRKYVCIY